MKRFSLNTKRASKVLALTLVAAMVVPSVPAQKSSAEAFTEPAPAGMPEAVATVSFESESDFVASDTVGKTIKFSGAAVTSSFDYVSSDGVTVWKQFESKDQTAEKAADGSYVYEDIDVTPEIVYEGTGTGSALSLKEQKSAVKYPSAAPNDASTIQQAKTYYSAAEIKNPFAQYRNELYDASRYTLDKIAETATEKEIHVTNKEDDGWEYTDESATFPDLKNRYSAPEAKTGVTIAFWAKVPWVAASEDSDPDPTNFFEFGNTETLIYSPDDMAKAWIAKQYWEAVDAGTLDDKDSPFYSGDEVEGTVVGVHADCMNDFKTVVGSEYTEGTEQKFKYLDNSGLYMKWNPKTATVAGAIDKGNGQYKVYTVMTIDTNTKVGKKEIVVDSGKKNSEGKTLYYHLKWADPVYVDGDESANITKYQPTKEYPYGEAARSTLGGTGQLYMATNKLWYQRENNSLNTGIVQSGSDKGAKGCVQQNACAQFVVPEIVEAMEQDEDEAGDWHYYTISLTDEWFQVYVDGVAADPSKVTDLDVKDKFNLGSGMIKPDGSHVGGFRTDYQKLCNNDFNNSIYGDMFGVTVMDYITDPNTKLYVGGKTQNTVDGTLIDEMVFYKDKLTEEQVTYDYKRALAKSKEVKPPKPVDPDVPTGPAVTTPEAIKVVDFENASDIIGSDGTTGTAMKFTDETVTTTWVAGVETKEIALGDVDQTGEINTDDALLILKHAVAGADSADRITDEDKLIAANVDKNTDVNTDDALLVLKSAVAAADSPDKITEVLSVETEKTYESKDKAPVTQAAVGTGGAVYVYEDFDVAPEVVADADDAEDHVLELKSQKDVVKYPSAAPSAEYEIQSAKSYYSGVQVENPFTALRDKLFDADRYTFANVAKTATEKEIHVTNIEDDGWEYDAASYTFSALRNRNSAPEAKTGVTLSFWAKVPYVDDNTKTNFFEFSNTETVVYSPDDIAKSWVAKQYADAVAAGTVDNADSPFYTGTVAEGVVIGVHSDCATDYEAITGQKFEEGKENPKFKYLVNGGMYMKWNPKTADTEAAIQKTTEKKNDDGTTETVPVEGQYKVYSVASISTSDKVGKKEIVVDSGLKNDKNETIYYHLKWSDTVYGEGAEDSYLARFTPTAELPYGKATKSAAGATGQLYMATDKTYYIRDNNALKTGVGLTGSSTEVGQKMSLQNGANAEIANAEVAEAALDEEWHFYTVSFTDEWFQVYVDGVACDPTKATISTQDKFNLGSGMIKPDGTQSGKYKSDFQKICNDDWSGSIYGNMFGVTVMDYITDANTKLYLGGKTQNTVAGTQIDDVSFFDKVLSQEQVAAVYAEAMK